MGEAIVTSKDGVQWDRIPANSCHQLQGVCYGNGRFVAVSDSGQGVAVSSDGANWGCIASLPSRQPLDRIVFGNNQFVAVGRLGTIVSSDDGLSWKSEQQGDVTGSLYDVTGGNDLLVAGCASALGFMNIPVGRAILYSLDGVSTPSSRDLK